MSTKDTKGILVLLLLGIMTHFLLLSWPKQVVFDEVHFGKFVTAYCCTGQRFFDIHPPHAKLLIAAVGWLGGYRGSFDFNNIGEDYGSIPIAALRFVPALAGVLLPLIIYCLLRELGGKRPISFLGAMLVLFDNAMVVQTRIIALDGVLLVATFGSLAAFLAAQRYRDMRQWWLYILAGALAGLAVGTKFTGLAAVGLLGILVLVNMIRERSWASVKAWVGRGAAIVASAFVVYTVGWAFHFALLTLPGSGDAFLKPDFSSGPWIVNFARETVALHKVMFSANYGLKATHPYASPWWSWPLMQRAVFYWQGDLPSDGSNRSEPFIYFLGNPVVWWGTTFLALTVFITSIVMFGQGIRPEVSPKYRPAQIWIPFIGFLIAMMPMMRIPRALFLYHYLTPLMFLLMFGFLWLQNLGLFINLKEKWERNTYIGILAITVIAFFVFSPLTYGIPVAQSWRDGLFWLKTWR